MTAKAVALHLITAALLSSSLLSSTAAAIEPEKQPIFSNIQAGSLCGTHSPPFQANPCTVPAGFRLIIEHVSGFAIRPTSANTQIAVPLVINDPGLGLSGNAFHIFVATKTDATVTDTFSFNTPFRMMLSAGATFHFEANAVAVSGYLVKQ